MGAVDGVFDVENLAQLPAQDRDRVGGRHIRLAGEQPEEADLTDDAAVAADVAHAHVIHLGPPMHRREAVGLCEHEQIAVGEPPAEALREAVDQLGPLEPRVGIAVQDAEAGTRNHRDRLPVRRVFELILAVAKEDEVLVEQPLEERHSFVDVLTVIARRAVTRHLDHPIDGPLHRLEVGDCPRHGAEDPAQCVGKLLGFGGTHVSLQLVVLDRLAVGSCPGGGHGLDRGLGAVLYAYDRVDLPLDIQVSRLDLVRDRVNQKGHVVGRDLDHGPGRLVAVGLEIRGVDPDHRVRPGSLTRELEQPGDLGTELVGIADGQVVHRRPAQVHLGEVEGHVGGVVEPLRTATMLQEGFAQRCPFGFAHHSEITFVGARDSDSAPARMVSGLGVSGWGLSIRSFRISGGGPARA